MLRRLFICSCLLSSFMGCGGPSGPPKVKITGQVTLNGAPLESGLINFIPSDGKGGVVGSPIEKGQYTVELSSGAKRVEINSPKVVGKKAAYETPNSPMMDILEERIPPEYNALSSLTADVKSNSTTFNFDLKATDR